MSKSIETQNRIAEAALKLFNSKGTGEVTTHDIADACQLSPGNLYYHFKNKEEIVALLFSKIELFSVDKWKEAISKDENQGFYQFVNFFFSEIRKYRFFFRELSELVRNDAHLARLWQKAHSSLLKSMQEAAGFWVEQGILEPFDSQAEVTAFIDNHWIIMSFGASYFESTGKIASLKLEEKLSQQLYSFLRPYHTAKGRKLLDEYFNQ